MTSRMFSVNHKSGIAGILGGGPQIPRDPTMGVRAIAGEGHEQAVALWPNPMREELHIAWRGDLRRMPSRFVVYDMLGREVARGDVEPGRGAALWRCGDLPGGVYLLSIHDSSGVPIATARVVKRD